MSSEEMRIELERFVNAGLEEGWHGWPRKAETRPEPYFRARLHATAEGAGRETRGDSASFVEPHGTCGSLRLFDWERRMIRAGARFVSQQSRS
jgi:hypothetical protein